MQLLNGAALAFVLTLVAVLASLPLLRNLNLIDRPTSRSSHSIPTIRGAGLGIAVGVLGTTTFVPEVRHEFALLSFSALCALVGLVDDRGGLTIRSRLLLQTLGGVVATIFVLSSTDVSVVLRLLLGAAVLIWIVGFVNAFNFFDGLNGLATSQGLCAGLCWYIAGQLTDVPLLSIGGLIVSASCLAFAPFNFPRARAFLGDVGSYFLGAWLGVLAVTGYRDGVPPEAILAPLVILLTDTSVTRVRRLARGQDWHLPNRDHVYQRLTDLGWSHTRVTVVVFFGSLASGAFGLVTLSEVVPLRVLGDLVVVTFAAVYLSLPACIQRLQMRR